MNLNHLQDADLLTQIKNFVQTERDVVVKILHHLREIERRRLFSDLGYKSLFDYALGELKYSEGQAARRIQAMRLLRDLPQVEEKIATGALSLSNVHQAQSFFRDIQANEPCRIVTSQEKLDVLEKLEHKSVRDAQKELLKIDPKQALPKEKERAITETTSEVRFLVTDKLKAKLESVRSLLGIKGTAMSYAELIDVMSDLSISALEAKQFGKKRTQGEAPKKQPLPVTSVEDSKDVLSPSSSSSSRYISKALKHEIWRRDKGACVNCGSRKNLNYDHIQPVALGGESTVGNLRLLCFHCNQRASAKIFGVWPVLKTGQGSHFG